MPTSTKSFSLSIADDALVVSGEIDVDAADDFLRAAVSFTDPTREMVLDVAGLEFIDSAGITAIVKLGFEACPFGLVLRSPRDNLLRVLDIIDAEQIAGIRVERRGG